MRVTVPLPLARNETKRASASQHARLLQILTVRRPRIQETGKKAWAEVARLRGHPCRKACKGAV